MEWAAILGEWMGWGIFFLVIFIGIILNFLGLFGNWLFLLAIGTVAALSGFEHFGIITLVILLALAIIGEVVEALASGVGAAKFGGGKGAMAASVIGCILGAIIGTPLIPIPLIGTLIGACIGAFAGATFYEHKHQEKELEDAMKVGFGAALGKVGGLFAKSFIGFIMLAIAAWTY